MTKRDIVAIALKIYGVVLLVRTLGEMPQSVQFVSIAVGGRFSGYESPASLIAVTIVSTLVWLVMAIALIFQSNRIAGILVPEHGESPLISMEGNSRILFLLALKIIGVVLLVTALPDLIQTYAQLVMQLRYAGETTGTSLRDAFSTDVWVREWAAVVRSVTVILISIGLIWGSSIVQGAKTLYERAFPSQSQEQNMSE